MLLQSSHTAEVDEVTMDQGANIRPLPVAVKTEPGTAQEVSLDIGVLSTVMTGVFSLRAGTPGPPPCRPPPSSWPASDPGSCPTPSHPASTLPQT